MHRVMMGAWAVATLIAASQTGWRFGWPVALMLGGVAGVWTLSRLQRIFGERD